MCIFFFPCIFDSSVQFCDACCAIIPSGELMVVVGHWESTVSVFADYRVVRAIRNCKSIRRLLYISCKPEGEAMRNFLE